MTIRDVPKGAFLVQGRGEIESILDSIGCPERQYDGLFVLVAEGEYQQVWGFYGVVPYPDLPVWDVRQYA